MPEMNVMTMGAALCALCTLVATLAAKPWKSADASTRLAALPAIGLAIGFFVAILYILDRPEQFLPPKNRWQWLYFAPFPIIAAGVLEALVGTRGVIKTVIVTLAVVLAIVITGMGRVYPDYARAWEASEMAGWTGMSAILATASTLASWLVSRRIGARPVVAAWVVAAIAGFGACAFLASFASLGNASAMLVPGVLALAAVCFVFPKFSPGLSVWGGISILATALISAALDPWYGSMQVPHGVLLLLAPLGMLAGLIADRSRWWAPPVVAMLATVAIACWPIGATISTYLSYREQGFAP